MEKRRKKRRGANQMNEIKFIIYADMKSKLTSLLSDFIKICDEQGRDSRSEIEDCIYDAKM